MLRPVLVRVLALVLVLNGIFFASNIIVLGSTSRAIAMHWDLAPDAGPWMAQGKVVVCFLAGLGYLAAAWGLWRQRAGCCRLGEVAAWLFLAFYVLEALDWGRSHPRVWLGFAIFGGLALAYAILLRVCQD
jgi:hypothetical protein